MTHAGEQALFTNGVPQPIKLLLSGHIRNFRAVKISNASYAPQMVVGNSGTLLDPAYVPTNSAGGALAAAMQSTGAWVPEARASGTPGSCSAVR